MNNNLYIKFASSHHDFNRFMIEKVAKMMTRKGLNTRIMYFDPNSFEAYFGLKDNTLNFDALVVFCSENTRYEQEVMQDIKSAVDLGKKIIAVAEQMEHIPQQVVERVRFDPAHLDRVVNRIYASIIESNVFQRRDARRRRSTTNPTPGVYLC